MSGKGSWVSWACPHTFLPLKWLLGQHTHKDKVTQTPAKFCMANEQDLLGNLWLELIEEYQILRWTQSCKSPGLSLCGERERERENSWFLLRKVPTEEWIGRGWWMEKESIGKLGGHLVHLESLLLAPGSLKYASCWVIGFFSRWTDEFLRKDSESWLYKKGTFGRPVWNGCCLFSVSY